MMTKILQWTVTLLNPIVVGSMFPVPLVQYGHLSWEVVGILFLVYVVLWLGIWKVSLKMGANLTIGG